MITIERLRQRLHYAPETGVLTWRARPTSDFPTYRAACSWNGRYAGKVAGSYMDGYVRVSIDGQSVLGHRVGWALETGAWPVDDIDHINHVRSDNRFANLRDVPRSDNNRNHPRGSRNTSGVTGVSWDKRLGKWRVSIGAGAAKHVGFFDSRAKAIQEREKAATSRGFHPNHGMRSARRSYTRAEDLRKAAAAMAPEITGGTR